jgi:hypothetical protein
MCNTHCYSTVTMVLIEHLIVVLYVHCLSRYTSTQHSLRHGQLNLVIIKTYLSNWLKYVPWISDIRMDFSFFYSPPCLWFLHSFLFWGDIKILYCVFYLLANVFSTKVETCSQKHKLYECSCYWRSVLSFCRTRIISYNYVISTTNQIHTSLSILFYWCSKSRHVSGITFQSSGDTTRMQLWWLLCAVVDVGWSEDLERL